MVYDETPVYVVREMLIVVLKIAAPILVSGVAVGLTVSLLQSITSIQDQTLTFVPKIVVMVTVAILMMPWIIMRIVDFASEMFLLF